MHYDRQPHKPTASTAYPRFVAGNRLLKCQDKARCAVAWARQAMSSAKMGYCDLVADHLFCRFTLITEQICPHLQGMGRLRDLREAAVSSGGLNGCFCVGRSGACNIRRYPYIMSIFVLICQWNSSAIVWQYTGCPVEQASRTFKDNTVPGECGLRFDTLNTERSSAVLAARQVTVLNLQDMAGVRFAGSGE